MSSLRLFQPYFRIKKLYINNKFYSYSYKNNKRNKNTIKTIFSDISTRSQSFSPNNIRNNQESSDKEKQQNQVAPSKKNSIITQSKEQSNFIRNIKEDNKIENKLNSLNLEKHNKNEDKKKIQILDKKSHTFNKISKNLSQNTYSQNIDKTLISFQSCPPKLPKMYKNNYSINNLNIFSSTNSNFGLVKRWEIPNVFYNHLLIFNSKNNADKNLNYLIHENIVQRTKGKLITFKYYKYSDKSNC